MSPAFPHKVGRCPIATGEDQRAITKSFRKNKVIGSKWKRRSAVPGDESKANAVKNTAQEPGMLCP